MSEQLEGPGGAAAVGWLAGILAVAAGGYLLGVSPAWSLPDPLYAELSWPLGWVAVGGAWIGAGLLVLGAVTVLDGLRASVSWTRWRTALTLCSLIGVTLTVASQGQSLSLTPAQASSRSARQVARDSGVAKLPTPSTKAEVPLEPLEALLARLDSRRGSENLGVVEGLARHGLAALPTLRTYVLEPRSAGGPYAVYALTQILLRNGSDPSGLEALLGCLDPSFPPAVQAQAATGLTLLGDPRTAQCVVEHYRGQPELREALFAISGQQLGSTREAAEWLLDARGAGLLPAQLQGAQQAFDDTTRDQISELLGLLTDRARSTTSDQAVAELVGVGPAAIPGLIDLIERRMNGSAAAAGALGQVLRDQALEERPPGALKVLVECAAADDYVLLQLSALEGLVQLADPRTLQALIPHLDADNTRARETCRRALEALTEVRFATRAAAEAWWAEHGEGFGVQVGVE